MRSKTLALSLLLLLLSACGGGGDGATLSGNAETEFAAIKSTYQERRFEEASLHHSMPFSKPTLSTP